MPMGFHLATGDSCVLTSTHPSTEFQICPIKFTFIETAASKDTTHLGIPRSSLWQSEFNQETPFNGSSTIRSLLYVQDVQT
jgi:hypothetical protein